MRTAQSVEQAVGISYYVSDADGTGGRLRSQPEDFQVREIEAFDSAPLDADQGGYPHLVVRATLHNWDTNDFATALANKLGISRERVSWAGTKDKRAVTSQLVSVDGIDAADLPDLDSVSLEPVGRSGRPILFGDLAGNEFEVTVREPERPENAESITNQLEAFAGDVDEVGVPNYFGQQRFGSKRPVTHEVGLAIVRENWEAAVMAYVGNPSEREPAATQDAREFVEETRDWQEALERFPEALRHERSMLHTLASAGEPPDYRAALETVPENLQRLFVHAAQSVLFNRMLSHRLARGLPFDRPVAGDAVCFADRDAPPEFAVPDTDRAQRVTEERLETVTRHCERGRAFVTAPLVGTETSLADGEQGEIERAVLDEVGLAPADFGGSGTFESSGTRRAILVRTDLDLETEPLRFSFRLPRGSYATVLLREYLKTDPDAL